LDKREKYAHLLEMETSLPGQLEMVEGDLMTPDSYDDCLSGATFLFHTASPATGDWDSDPFLEIIEPAVQGTKNVLASAAKAGVERVVLTSSLFAVSSWIMPDDKANQPGAVLDESDWNQFLSDGGNPDMKILAYIVSKAKAEKAAWEEADRLSLSLVSINPVGVFGPILGDNSLTAGSVEVMKDAMLGLPGTADMNFLWCDTRDVAKAHIAAAETPDASGRHKTVFRTRQSFYIHVYTCIYIYIYIYTLCFLKATHHSPLPTPTLPCPFKDAILWATRTPLQREKCAMPWKTNLA
jgi:dihydroflavonol-4-reductase